MITTASGRAATQPSKSVSTILAILAFFASDFSWPNQFEALRSGNGFWESEFERRIFKMQFSATGIDRFRWPIAPNADNSSDPNLFF